MPAGLDIAVAVAHGDNHGPLPCDCGRLEGWVRRGIHNNHGGGIIIMILVLILILITNTNTKY